MSLRVLALDSGGVRSLCMLHTLKEIERLTGRSTYELFDVVGGVSAGGMLAYLLFVYRLSVDECIVAVRMLIEAMRAHPYSSPFRRRIVGMVSAACFADTADKYFHDLEARFNLSGRRQVPVDKHVFSVAATCTRPAKIRILEADEAADTEEIMKATTAGPTYHRPVAIGGDYLVDGAVLCNNPALICIGEAKKRFPHMNIACLVSLGTGRLHTDRPHVWPMRSHGAILRWVGWLLQSMFAHDTHNTLAEYFIEPERLFRINPGGGQGHVDIVESNARTIGAMEAVAIEYARKHPTMMCELVAALSGGGFLIGLNHF
jgi:predicted acylesterase/phospholipase RssA